VLSPIAVVIPAAARSPWLSGAINSALTENAAAIFVVSEQPPAETAWEGSANHGGWIEVSPEGGFGARVNLGIAAARDEGFERVLVLNDDTLIREGAVAKLSSALDTPDVEIVGAVLQDWNDETVQLSGIEIFEQTARIRVQRDDPCRDVQSRQAVSGAAMMMDIATWTDLGGFCEDFTFYFEDIDFCHRVRARGGKVVICGAARVRHYQGGTRGHRSTQAAWHITRSQIVFAKRLGGGGLAQGSRVLSAAALGMAWTLRKLGPSGLAAGASGALSGLLWSARR
jgi:GT2 family glycosyltransferase